MTVEVRPEPILERWEVAELGISRGHFPVKTDAVAEARRIAKDRGAELVVYNLDHTVQERRVYPRNNGW